MKRRMDRLTNGVCRLRRLAAAGNRHYRERYIAGSVYTGVTAAGGGAGAAQVSRAAGTGGGASVALLAIASSLSISSSTFISMNGGDGEVGTFGSVGTAGGNPGFSYTATTEGLAGGMGGNAGISGSGAGGPSIAIAYTKPMPATDATTILTPGTAGAGVPAQSNGVKTIPLSASGVSATTYPF